MQVDDQLSVIIPTLNAAATLATCLARLGSGYAVIVSDGGSTDGTGEIARQAGARVVAGPAGRGGQLGRGAGAAAGPWLLFLHADCYLPPGWEKPVRAFMATGGGAAVFGLRFRARGVMARLVGAWAGFRTRAFGLPFGDQGLLISSRLYKEIGGFPDVPLMEDIAMARALGRGRITLLPVAVETGAERYLADGWIRHGARNMIRQVRFLSGAEPALLAKSYGTRR